MPTKPWLFVLGTRPEAIKLAPLVREFMKRAIPFEVCWTGQHVGLLDPALKAEMGGTELGLASANDPLAYVEAALKALGASLEPDRLRGVIVQGDTASAWSGAIWGVLRGISVAHVEAGLRSGDLDDPWPEEMIRCWIDANAIYRFCPTALAKQHLGTPEAVDVVTGNTVVDALQALGIRRTGVGAYALVTLHRRESFGAPLRAIVSGLCEVAAASPWLNFVWPLHSNPEVRRSLVGLTVPANVLLAEPLPYRAFVERLAGARAVLTDSGGVVEEAATLGVPCAIARDHTERPEAIDAGCAKLAGRSADSVATALAWALSATIAPSTCFGDGHASERIADCLENA